MLNPIGVQLLTESGVKTATDLMNSKIIVEKISDIRGENNVNL